MLEDITIDDATVDGLAQRLDEADRTRQQIDQFSLLHPQMGISDAYRVQRAWMKLKHDAGRASIGRKIGLTSRGMQRSVNITEPDYGLLLDDMLHADGQEIDIHRFIEPRVEVELAFILKRRLEGAVTLFDVLNATDYIVPALEIIDARIRGVSTLPPGAREP